MPDKFYSILTYRSLIGFAGERNILYANSNSRWSGYFHLTDSYAENSAHLFDEI